MLKTIIGLLFFAVPVHAEVITLNQTNLVAIRSVIDTDSTMKASMELVNLVKLRGLQNYPIYLLLDSPGGSIESGLDFIAFAKTFKNIKTISMFAASMASGIVEAMPGERLVTKESTLMFHRAKGQIQGQFETGEVESELAYFKSVVRNMESVTAKRIGISLEEYKSKVINEWWVYGDQNIEQHTADRLVELECDAKLIDQQIKTIIDFGLFKIPVKMSACPLLKGISPDTDGDEDRK